MEFSPGKSKMACRTSSVPRHEKLIRGRSTVPCGRIHPVRRHSTVSPCWSRALGLRPSSRVFYFTLRFVASPLGFVVELRPATVPLVARGIFVHPDDEIVEVRT